MTPHTGGRTGPSFLLVLLAAVVAGNPLQAAPELYVSGTIARHLLMSPAGYQLYWMREDISCAGGEFAPPCFIDGVSANSSFGWVTNYHDGSALTSDVNNVHSSNIAVDVNYQYWLGESTVRRRQFGHRDVGFSETVAVMASSNGAEIVVDDSWVYWTENTAGGGVIYRASKTGGVRTLVYENTVDPITQLATDGAGGVWFVTSCGVFTIDVLHRSTQTGGVFGDTCGPGLISSFTLDDTNAYAIAGTGNGPRTLYRAPLTNLAGFTSGTIVAETGENPVIPTMANDATSLFWYKDRTGSNDFIYQLAKSAWSAGNEVAITLNRTNVADLRVNARHLFWREGFTSILRLELDTIVEISADLGITAIEVVQAVQTPDNQVDLVADKRTLVRVYPEAVNLAGTTSANAVVRLAGRVMGGGALPGSPLPAQMILVQPGALDRTNLNATANFWLPQDWRTGTIELTASIKTVSVEDPNSLNDDWTEPGLAFLPKSAICIKFLPIDTTVGLTYRVRSLETSLFTPSFLDIIQRFQSMWPSPQLRYYTPWISLRKPEFLGPSQPFNMTGAADSDHLLAALYEHNVWDNAPGWCEAGNARTHYVAMVHSGINTVRPSGGTRLGTARLGEPLGWTKMTENGADFEQPEGGGVLVHEITHNFNNIFGTSEDHQHVNCGLPAGADFNANYPYDIDSIGLVGGVINANAGWGFDPVSGTVIAPAGGRDFMAYCNPTWVSDYGWNRTLSNINDSTLVRAETRGGVGSDVLVVSGLVNDDELSGEILTAYYVPAPLSVPLTESGGTGEWGATGNFTLELLDGGGGVLATHAVVPTRNTEYEVGQPETFYFHKTVPYVGGLSSFRVVRNGTTSVVSANVSPNTPAVTLLSPGPGAILSAPLTLNWTASDIDNDPLNYLVQYSADGGITWTLLAMGLSDTTVTLDDASGLAASSNAFLRVIASDGVNIGYDTVGPMTSPNHAPAPAVLAPVGNASFPVGAPVVLDGAGYDPDEGPLAAAALSWSLSGPTTVVGNGAQLLFNDLPPGAYTATLTATDGLGLSNQASADLFVETKSMSDAAAPVLDGFCDDAAYYADDEPLLIRYGSETGVVRFVHEGSHLYACFDNLPKLSMPNLEAVWLYADPDASGETSVQSTDVGIQLMRSGFLQTYSGSLGVFSVDIAPVGVAGAVAERGSVWSGELRVDTGQLFGWNHLASVRVAHENSNAFQFGWPLNGQRNNPSTWGLSAFGLLSQSIVFPQPADATAGDDPVAANAAATSNLPVSVESLTPIICTVSLNNSITPNTAGVCNLQATQNGNDSYSPAVPVSVSFEVFANTIDAGEPNDTAATAAPLNGACPRLSIDRRLDEPGDIDFYRFTGPAGLPVRIDIDANEIGSTLDAVLGAFDLGGVMLGVSNNDPAPGEFVAFDSYLQVAMPDDGELIIAVTGFDDFDFDGIGDGGGVVSSGDYTLVVHCSPEPGQLLATTGSVGNVLLDIDTTTGEGTTRAQVGILGPLVDLAWCGGNLIGGVGSGKSRLVDVDPINGDETLLCDYAPDTLSALTCIDDQLYGSWTDRFQTVDTQLVKVADPVTVSLGSIAPAGIDIESTSPVVLEFTAGSGPVNMLHVQLDVDAFGNAWGSDVHVTITHTPTGFSFSLGTAFASCLFYGVCDYDLGWANSSGNFTADITVPFLLFDGAGEWQVVVQMLFNQNGVEGRLNSALVDAGQAECELTVVGVLGDHVPGLAYDESGGVLYGCTAGGVLLSIDPDTAATTPIGNGGEGNCRALGFAPASAAEGAASVLYAGSGASTQFPGLLYTFDTSTGTTTPIGMNSAGGLSGLAAVPPDTDRDTVFDAQDNCIEIDNVAQTDTDGDAIGNHCDADISPANNDCIVNFGDLGALKAAFFATPKSPNWNPDADFDGNDAINFGDLGIMKAGFFQPPGPAATPNGCDQ